MSASDELERGRLAAEVLNNAVYQDALSQLKHEVTKAWQTEKSELQREHLWQMNQAVSRLESILADTMATGRLQAESLRRKQTLLQRGKQLLGV